MRVIRKAAFQGHSFPTTRTKAWGPFPVEVLAEPVITYDDTDPDNIYPPGASAQNNYQGVPLYRCRDCSATLTGDQLDDHICEDPADGQD
jgi:hypothetical protein